MSDENLRVLERRWRETADDRDGAAWLRARLRAGTVDPKNIELAAALGFWPAIIHLADDAPDTIPDGSRPLLAALERRGRPWVAAALLLTAEQLHLPRWEAGRPGDARLREALFAYRGWIESGAAGAPPAVPDLELDRDGREMLSVLAAAAREDETPSTPWLMLPTPRPTDGLRAEDGARALRSALVEMALGVAPTPRSLGAFTRVRARVVATDDAPAELVAGVVRWLDGLPGPAPRRLRFSHVPQRVSFGPDLAETERRYQALPGVPTIEGTHRRGDPLIFVTTRRDAQGWFARHLAGVPEVCVIHLDDAARTRLEAAPEVFLAHMIGKKILDGFLGYGGLSDAELPRHDPSRGCVFDFCPDKVSIDARIRAASLCRECDRLLRARALVSTETIEAVVRILEDARRALLDRRHRPARPAGG